MVKFSLRSYCVRLSLLICHNRCQPINTIKMSHGSKDSVTTKFNSPCTNDWVGQLHTKLKLAYSCNEYFCAYSISHCQMRTSKHILTNRVIEWKLLVFNTVGYYLYVIVISILQQKYKVVCNLYFVKLSISNIFSHSLSEKSSHKNIKHWIFQLLLKR